jgi:predicted site-specific integrase-resolvase
MGMYTIRQFSERIGVSVKTLQRWDREGKLIPLRTPSNRRQYTDEHIRQALGLRGIQTTIETRKTVVYMRVSSPAQKPDLDNQRHALEQFCAARGLTVDEWIAEIGGGLNFKRPKFLQLVDAIVAHHVGTLIIAHKDRLARFGYDLLTHLCTMHQCTILVLNQETLSPEQEMVQDLMTIIHCFSSRLPGLRHYRKSLKKVWESHDTRPQNTVEPNP